jgi:hypothetical protein
LCCCILQGLVEEGNRLLEGRNSTIDYKLWNVCG